jgi:hypothetical protein
MNLDFEIIQHLYLPERGNFILARQINITIMFAMKDGATLNGIPLLNFLDMPRLLDEKGRQRYDVFVFCAVQKDRLSDDIFSKGSVVQLVIPD